MVIANNQLTLNSFEIDSVLNSNTSLNLVWSLSGTGIYTINVNQSLNGVVYFPVITNLVDVSYTVQNLVQNSLYYFRLDMSSNGSNASLSSSYTTGYTPIITSFYSKPTLSYAVPLFWSGSYYQVAVQYKKTIDIGASFITYDIPIGASSLVVNGLDPSTNYDFQIIPYDLGGVNGSASNLPLPILTDYIPFISNFICSKIYSTSVTLLIDGLFGYAAVQYSSDGGNTFQTTTVTELTIGDSYNVSALLPGTMYIFRVIPYTLQYNSGITSNVISATTLPGVSSYYVQPSTITTNSATVKWTFWNCDSVQIFWNISGLPNVTYKSVPIPNKNNAPRTSTTLQRPDGSYNIQGLMPYVQYQTYLLPCSANPDGSPLYGTYTPIASFLTDFNPTLSVIVGNAWPSSTDLSFGFNTNGIQSPFSYNIFMDLSTNGGLYDTSMYLRNGPFLTAQSASFSLDISMLQPNTPYSVKFTPISLYGVSGNFPQTLTSVTLGDISQTSLNLVVPLPTALPTAAVSCSGHFGNIIVQTSNDNINYSNVVKTSPNVTSITSSNLLNTFNCTIKLDPSNAAMIPTYVRVIPVNSVNAIQLPSYSLYIPAIARFTLSGSYYGYTQRLLSWNGTFAAIIIQSSIDGGNNYTTVSGTTIFTSSSGSYIDTTSLISPSGTIIYRAIPYSRYLNDGVSVDISSQGLNTVGVLFPQIFSYTIGLLVQSDASAVVYWAGSYSYVTIQSCLSGTNVYNTIATVSAINGVTSYSISGQPFSFSTQVYYIRIIPYSIAVSGEIITGNSSGSIYNPLITSISATPGNNVNQIVVTYSGIYSHDSVNNNGTIFYGLSGSNINLYTDPSSSQLNLGSGGTTTIPGLLPNRIYSIGIIPFGLGYKDITTYTKGVPSIIKSCKTGSFLTNLTMTYDASNSSSTSVRLFWSDTCYNTISVYDNSPNPQIIVSIQSPSATVPRGPTFYDITSLIPNSVYTYNIRVYDTAQNYETQIINTATMASFTDIALGYTSTMSDISFTWSNREYTELTIQNTTTNTTVSPTYKPTTGTGYNSKSTEILLPNRVYSYRFLLKNTSGSWVFTDVSATTAPLLTLTAGGFHGTTSAFDTSTVQLTAGGYYDNLSISGTGGGGGGGGVPSSLPSFTGPNNVFKTLLIYYPFWTNDYNNYVNGSAPPYGSASATVTGGTSNGVSDTATTSLGNHCFNCGEGRILSVNPVYPNNKQRSTTGGITISFWYQLSGLVSSLTYLCQISPLISLVYNITPFGVTRTSSGLSTSLISRIGSIATVSDNLWHHCAVTFDPSAKMIMMYNDGIQSCSGTWSNVSDLSNNSFSTIINCSGSTFTNLYLQEFAIYDTYQNNANFIQNLFKIGNNPITINVPLTNTQYTFTATGTNSSPEMVTASCGPVATLASLPILSIGVIDTSSVQLLWEGSFNYVCISRTGVSDISSTALHGTTITGLLSHTTYTFSVTPFNQPLFNGQSVSGLMQTISGTTAVPICNLWLDAKDICGNGTTIPSDGALVASWTDKSGYGNNATNVSLPGGVSNGNVVYASSGLNSLPSLKFNNTQYLSGTISITNTTNSISIFAVCSVNNQRWLARLIVLGVSGGNYTNAGSVGLLRGGYDYDNFGNLLSSNWLCSYRGTNAIGRFGPSPSTSRPYLHETWYDGSSGNMLIQQGAATITYTAPSTGNFNISNFMIGQDLDPPDYTNLSSLAWFSGCISEILVYNAALNTTDRQYVEGYLSWKWGLQSNLSTNHPYGSSPPAGFSPINLH